MMESFGSEGSVWMLKRGERGGWEVEDSKVRRGGWEGQRLDSDSRLTYLDSS